MTGDEAPDGGDGDRPDDTDAAGRASSGRAIGLFELTWHPQNLRELCRIADAEADDVTVFADEATYEDWLADADIDTERYEWVLRGDDERLASYFERAEAVAGRDLDFLLVLTPFGSGVITSHFVEFDPDCATACYLYNSQAVIDSTREATDAREDLRDVTPRLRRALLPEDPETAERSLKPFRYYVRPYVLENYDAFVVEYPPIREHLDEHWDWDRPVYEFSPYAYDEESARRAPDGDDGPVRFTVSGRVVENVRDYDEVLDVFETVFAARGEDVALDVLGRPVGDYGDRVMERCRALDERGFPVTYYPDTDWIPTEEFDRVLRRSDVLLNPIYLVEETTREPAPDEIRGTTKGTGVLFDALKHGKPLILPEGFTVAPMIDGATETYDTGPELREVVEGFLDDPERLRDRKRAARENAAEFAVEPQRERFDAIVHDVLGR